MKYLLSALLPLLLFSCNKTEKQEQPFDSFVYSFTALRIDYMVKFTNTDTVYFLKRFPKPETVSFAIMEKSKRDSITTLIKKIDFAKYKSEYNEENLVDATGIRFESTKASVTKTIDIYGGTAPKELYDYTAEFNKQLKHLNFQPFEGKVTLVNLYVLL
jgi:hypothetical protein